MFDTKHVGGSQEDKLKQEHSLEITLLPLLVSSENPVERMCRQSRECMFLHLTSAPVVANLVYMIYYILLQSYTLLNKYKYKSKYKCKCRFLHPTSTPTRKDLVNIDLYIHTVWSLKLSPVTLVHTNCLTNTNQKRNLDFALIVHQLFPLLTFVIYCVSRTSVNFPSDDDDYA